MKKAIVVLVIILLTLFIGMEVKASPFQKSIIPAQADWVIHFDLEKFVSTKIGELILSGGKLSGLAKKNAQFHRKYKIDLLKDIKAITLYGTEKKEENTVVCLRGNFNQAFLLGLLSAESSHREIPHGEHTIHNWNHDEYGSFVGNELALISQNEEMLKTALDVIDGKTSDITTSPLMSYVNQIPSDAFLAAMLDNVSSMIEKDVKVLALKKTQSAFLAIRENNKNVNMKLNFTVETSEDANKMEDVLKGLIALANMQLAEKDTELRLPEDITISTEGNKVMVEMSYPSEDLLDILKGRKAFPPFSLLARYHDSP